MIEIELNGQQYRCVRPRDKNRVCPWGGYWEWFSPYTGWKELLSYNRKKELNEILNNQP